MYKISTLCEKEEEEEKRKEGLPATYLDFFLHFLSYSDLI